MKLYRTNFDNTKAGKICLTLICLLFFCSCEKDPVEKTAVNKTLPQSSEGTTRKNDISPLQVLESYSPDEYRTAREKITYGNATLAEVRMALTDPDPAELTNTAHALYSMRWHRGVYKLLYQMWDLNKGLYPELNWDEVGKEPVRLALASTLNRIQIADTGEFQDYIRSFKEHEHEFVRSQAVVALGFNGDPDDLPYLVSQVRGDNDYVARSAIASLGFMNNPEARDELKELGKEFDGTERGSMVDNILRNGYGLFRKDQQ